MLLLLLLLLLCYWFVFVLMMSDAFQLLVVCSSHDIVCDKELLEEGFGTNKPIVRKQCKYIYTGYILYHHYSCLCGLQLIYNYW